MCGESKSLYEINPKPQGSPPHVWGIRVAEYHLYRRFRITPTCVGNTRPLRAFPRLRRDHPHMCGEYLKKPVLYGLFLGSLPHLWGIRLQSVSAKAFLRIAPHVWGIRFGISMKPAKHRITPTCVGNTVSDRHAHGNP